MDDAFNLLAGAIDSGLLSGPQAMELLAEAQRVADICLEVVDERARQAGQWGVNQSHPDGTVAMYGHPADQLAEHQKWATEEARERGLLSWTHILMEEVFEAIAETDPAKKRVELIQVAAVCAAWIQDIDSRQAGSGVSVVEASIPPINANSGECPCDHRGCGSGCHQ